MLCGIKHDEIQCEYSSCEKNCAAYVDNDSRTNNFLTKPEFGGLVPIMCVKNQKIIFTEYTEIKNILKISKTDIKLKYFLENLEEIKRESKRLLHTKKTCEEVLDKKQISDDFKKAYKDLLIRIEYHLSNLRNKIIQCTQRY